MIEVLERAALTAKQTSQSFLDKHGDHDACGFAWVTVHDVRINSKIGKQLVAAGFRKDYGKGLLLWNPSQVYTQAITAKEKGAEAYAKILRDELGLKAYALSRMD